MKKVDSNRFNSFQINKRSRFYKIDRLKKSLNQPFLKYFWKVLYVNIKTKFVCDEI